MSETFFPQGDLPPPFVCVVCGREQTAQNWTRRAAFKPPICHYCTVSRGHQVRIPGMTRGDHHELQRLTVITNALISTASIIDWEAKHGRFTAE